MSSSRTSIANLRTPSISAVLTPGPSLEPSSPRAIFFACWVRLRAAMACRSEEHTSELQSLMRISYAVFCLKKKKDQITDTHAQLVTHLYISKPNSVMIATAQHDTT